MSFYVITIGGYCQIKKVPLDKYQAAGYNINEKGAAISGCSLLMKFI